VVFGARAEGILTIDTLLGSGIKFDWIIDRNPDMNGKNINGIPIRPLSSLYELKDQFVLLSICYITSMIDDCNKYNVKKLILPVSMNKICVFNSQFGIYKNLNQSFM
jgi:hypothetical protein